jgi:hypothetical protein
MTKDTLDLSYAAGLFDGEGTVGLVRRHRNCYRSPMVSVPSCTPHLLSWLWTRFGGSISTKRCYKKGHSPSGVWALGSDASLKFLDLIFPYMREPEKIRRARMLIEEYKSVTSRNGKYTPATLERKRIFEKAFFRNTRKKLSIRL